MGESKDRVFTFTQMGDSLVCSRCADFRQRAVRAENEIKRLRKAGDRLAYLCGKAIMQGLIRTRTTISDCVEDYLNVGGIGGPKTVPEWIEQYEAKQAAGGDDENT